jgi:hypothetical protein
MNSQNIFQSASADTAEIERLKAEILFLKAEVEDLKLSESVKMKAENEALIAQNARLRMELEVYKFSEHAQKTLATEQKAQTQALIEEVEKLNAEVGRLEQQSNQQSQMLVSLTAFAQKRRLHSELCIACINILEVSQKILERIFPDDRTVFVEAAGDILRIMFEGSLQQGSDFLNDRFDTIEFIVHAHVTEFMKFCKAMAIFFYSSCIKVPGTDFIVTAICKPRRERRFFTKDEFRFYERMLFEVKFFCIDTRRNFKFHFSCDAGNFFPEPNFSVNCLSFSEKYGFRVKSPAESYSAESYSVLKILRCIIDHKAEWIELIPHHLSILGKIMEFKLSERYTLSGIPWLERDECPISFDMETCLEYSGCGCSTCGCPMSRKLSLTTVLGIFVANRSNQGGLICPFCREELIYCTYQVANDNRSIDVSCIDVVPSAEEIKFHQDYAQSIESIYGKAESSLSTDMEELICSFTKLLEVQGQARSLPIFKHFGRIPDEDKYLFFPVDSQEIEIDINDADGDGDGDADADDSDSDDAEAYSEAYASALAYAAQVYANDVDADEAAYGSDYESDDESNID